MTSHADTLAGFVSCAPLTATSASSSLAAPNLSTRFTGNAVLAPSTRVLPGCNGHTIDTTPHMSKKGRFSNRQMPQRQQNISLPKDGTPVFALFVRTTRAKVWYPLGAVQGDDRSKDMVKGLKGGMARAMYQNALDKGIAQTVYGRDRERFYGNAVRMYPQLKKYTRDLEFGYKVAAVDLDDQPTKVVTQEMAMTFFQWAKKKVDDTLQGNNKNNS